jgi:hypothetical protein
MSCRAATALDALHTRTTVPQASHAAAAVSRFRAAQDKFCVGSTARAEAHAHSVCGSTHTLESATLMAVSSKRIDTQRRRQTSKHTHTHTHTHVHDHAGRHTTHILHLSPQFVELRDQEVFVLFQTVIKPLRHSPHLFVYACMYVCVLRESMHILSKLYAMEELSDEG